MMRAINPAKAGLHVSIVAAICAAVAMVSIGLVRAQETTRRSAAGIPRTSEGRPDLSGVWIAGAQPLLLGEAEAAKIRAADAAAKRPPFQREPPPYKPEYE